MLTKIDNDADEFATLQAVDETSPCAYPKLIALLANITPADEDLEIIIRKALLPDSYRANPTMLAKNAHARCDPDSFQSHGAYTLSNTHVGIKLMREEKLHRHQLIPAHRQSLTQRTLAWLDTDKDTPLEIPNTQVPPSTLARPEQFVYNIKRQTNECIQIKKFKHHIRITLRQ